MLYAKVVVGLAVEGPFDYSLPRDLEKDIKTGVRVEVSFRTRKITGYVVNLTRESHIKNIKPIIRILDNAPVLNKNMLLLAKEISRYYCCSLGEAIETILPEALRKGRALPGIEEPASGTPKPKGGFGVLPSAAKRNEIILIHDLDGKSRWDFYTPAIKEALGNNKSVIFCCPDIHSVLRAKELIRVNTGRESLVLFRNQPKESEEWVKIKKGQANLIVGTRSGIFAPLDNLGLVIIDEEEDSSYKQDQVPHYNLRETSFMRTKIEGASLILGSSSPSLESLYLAQRNKIKYAFIPRPNNFPQIQIIDTKQTFQFIKKRGAAFSKLLEDSIYSVLNSGGKILLFLNRRGFATFGACLSCGKVLKCPRCNVNLTFYFKDNQLSCRYCNFKQESPRICPECNSGYIKFSGTGIEKIESELSRIFPQARIKRLDGAPDLDMKEADIFVATSKIIRQRGLNFDLIGVVGIDNSLNRADLRASEKAFALLAGLLGLTEKKLIIETGLPNHHCFKSLAQKDTRLFYEEELRQRRQLGFPPYKHLALVKLRALSEKRVALSANSLFERLQEANKDKGIQVLSCNPSQPAKLRGKFHWQLLLSCGSVTKMVTFLKIHLKKISYSGIIVTVDVDPL